MKTTFIILGCVVLALLLFVLLKKRTSKKPADEEAFSEEEYNRHTEAKQAGLEKLLGPMHHTVGHAIVPFCIGGAVDMYYFPNGIPGTGFATMELIAPDGTGPKPNQVGTYELVSFTRHAIPDTDPQKDAEHPWHKIERHLCGILTAVGFYAEEAVLNPGDTCEIPGQEGEPNRCLILDEYKKDGASLEINGQKHCLLLCMEVFRNEMEYARKHGSAELLTKLQEAGHYPYSDLDREAVV